MRISHWLLFIIGHPFDARHAFKANVFSDIETAEPGPSQPVTAIIIVSRSNFAFSGYWLGNAYPYL